MLKVRDQKAQQYWTAKRIIFIHRLFITGRGISSYQKLDTLSLQGHVLATLAQGLPPQVLYLPVLLLFVWL